MSEKTLWKVDSDGLYRKQGCMKSWEVYFWGSWRKAGLILRPNLIKFINTWICYNSVLTQFRSRVVLWRFEITTDVLIPLYFGCGQKISSFKVEILIVNWNFVYAQHPPTHAQKERPNYFWKALPLPPWLRPRVRRCKGRRFVTYSVATAALSGWWPVTTMTKRPSAPPSCPPNSIQTTPSAAAKVSLDIYFTLMQTRFGPWISKFDP